MSSFSAQEASTSQDPSSSAKKQSTNRKKKTTNSKNKSSTNSPKSPTTRNSSLSRAESAARQSWQGPRSQEGLLKALRDKKFVILFCIAYLVPLYLVYLTLFMKIIFLPIINDDAYLATCAVILTVAGMVGAPFWGLVADRKGFKTTLLLVCLVDLATKIVGFFAASGGTSDSCTS